MSQKWNVDGHEIEVSNLEKPFFSDGTTKGDLLEYYRDFADLILPHLRERVVTIQRFPDGIDEEGFYQKRLQDWMPEWLGREEVDTDDGNAIEFVCESAADLVYLVNLGTITFHRWLSTRDAIRKPREMVFDLDPPDDDDFSAVRAAATSVRAWFDERGVDTSVMTTGSRGLHVVIALDGKSDFDEVRDVARSITGDLADAASAELTTEQRKAKREGRVYLDVARNAYAQTAVAPYSVRAREGAPIATPIEWDELDSDMKPDKYTISNLKRRLGQKDDPWATEPERYALEELR